MDKMFSCEFNIDTACVEVKYIDGSMISINCAKVDGDRSEHVRSQRIGSAGL